MKEIPGFGYGLFRKGETWNRNFQPIAVFHRRPIALLAAAVLPGTGRDAAFRLADKMTSAGFAVTDSTGQLASHSALFNEPLIAALHVLESIVSSPESLANLLEGAGSLALERAGAILDQCGSRLSSSAQKPPRQGGRGLPLPRAKGASQLKAQGKRPGKQSPHIPPSPDKGDPIIFDDGNILGLGPPFLGLRLAS